MKLFKNYTHYLVQLIAVLTLAISPISYAGPGHDHGDEKPNQQQAKTLPRFYAESDLYELVGVIRDKQITLYLDRYATNEAVKGANLEVEIDGVKMAVKPHGDGEYLIELKDKIKDQPTPISITINDGGVNDILVSTIDLSQFENSSVMNWKTWLKLLVLMCFVAGVAYWFYRNRELLRSRAIKIINQFKELA
jgi:hypothetical protein